VQRLAEPGAGVGHHRNIDTGCYRFGDIDLFGHGQKRFGDCLRSAGDIAAHVGSLETGLFDQPRTEGVIDRRHVEKRPGFEIGAEGAGFF
jgi:hypothetical protein